jgi:hypothetical protein
MALGGALTLILPLHSCFVANIIPFVYPYTAYAGDEITLLQYVTPRRDPFSANHAVSDSYSRGYDSYIHRS